MKLVKRENDYCLYNESEETIAASWANVTGKKLSKQNCDEIFGVVDVDVLATEHYKEYDNLPVIRYNSFTTGFNKAMELNKDKVFTEQDITNAMNRVWDWCEDEKDKDCSSMTELREKHIQSIQQPTEIDVEIEMEDIIQLKKRAGGLTNMGKPKLDSNGCLILRKL